jgi:two-component system, LytTR family, response regulator
VKIESIIIDKEFAISADLKRYLYSKFPEINIRGEASNCSDACKLIKAVNPDLIFTNVNVFKRSARTMETEMKDIHFEMVYMSDRYEDAISAIQEDVCGFILKPLTVGNVVLAVTSAIKKLSDRSSARSIRDPIAQDIAFLPHTKLVGIPTIEGIDFLHVHEIVRCEGLQKCTCIVSTRKQNLISSYNIGEFRKLLEEYGFFPCHKSHLINLMHVKKFTREGFVFLSDNAAVPLARRKRLEFLQVLKHL